ncbi:type I secretion system permease/ATPase [Mesorhizobium sp. NBSH29]|uniref:type I secretion system permease/ATPase n=1 Tax=Mesorhizobium sp. NBSH29 TaxID=2654249 RepID=UPI0018965776|nr:type I secretion system permease/ATPase [Mesorhizobium sp. NBSH29]QPC86692.1 type I secretion system permease/ATPase [Mesorhizobium sp. NBSH29]
MMHRAVVDIGVFSFVLNLLLLTMPLYLLQVYDRVLPSASLETLVYLSLIAVGSLCFLGLMEIIRSLYALRVAASIDCALGEGVFLALLGSERASGGDIQPLRDLATVRGFIGSRGLTTLFDLPFAPLFVVLLFFVHPLLFWVTLAGAGVLILIMVANQVATAKSGREWMALSSAANALAQAFARNADSVRALGMRSNTVEHWGRRFAYGLRVQARSASINAAFGGVSRVVRMLLQLAILGVGALLVLRGEMTAGMIFASSIISGRALQPLDQLIGGWQQTSDARHAWRRIRQLVAPAGQEPAARTQLPMPQGAISVHNLVYSAQAAQPGSDAILKRLNFSIKSGESVALIGPSRAGKSSLARLLVGAALPTHGSVRIDDADIRTWDAEQLGRHIGYLAQDVQLFPGTIAENISRFAVAPDDAGIITAAQRAHAHALILSQREGYQTQIDPSGATLSGGERQRIGLARAFYGSPQLLVLDEPNANLDNDGEAALATALEEARQGGTTVVIVTHRMPIAAKCDRVMLLRAGTIEALGPSEEVLRNLAAHRNAPDKAAQATSLATINLANGITGQYRTQLRTPGSGGAL